MKPQYIYGLHSGDGVIRYIGLTGNPRRRLNEHRSPAHWAKNRAARNNPELADWAEQNNPVQMRILEITRSPVDEARKIEAMWTRFYPETFNKAVGSEMPKGENSPWWGKHHTDEWRARTSARMSGENHHFYGKHLSADHRAKMGRGGTQNANSKFSDQDVLRIREMGQNGISSKVIADQFGVVRSTIVRVLSGATYKEVK